MEELEEEEGVGEALEGAGLLLEEAGSDCACAWAQTARARPRAIGRANFMLGC